MSEKISLPPFPVDEETLALLEVNMTTFGPDGKTSLYSTLDLLAGGPCGHADCEWVAEDIVHCKRQYYSDFDVILALIAKVRRLRASRGGSDTE